MKSMITFGLLLVVAAVNAQVRAPETYVAQIRRIIPGSGNLLHSIGGVVVTNRHVLTAAAPLRDIPISELRVYFSSPTTGTGVEQRTVNDVIFNPDNANIAIVVANYPVTDSVDAFPMGIGALSAAGSTCRAYFFNTNQGPLLAINMTLSTTNCPAGNAWCASHSSLGICTNFMGSPILCVDERIAGISFTENVCSAPGSLQAPIANLINVADNSAWIEDVTREARDSASSTFVSIVALVVGVALSKVL